MTDAQEEKERILHSFSAVTDVTLVDDMLELALSEEVSPSSTVITIISVALSKVGRDKVWEFVKENYDVIREKDPSSFTLGQIVKSTTESYASEEQAKDIEMFFSTKNVRGAERTIQQALETVRNNAAWLQRDKESIRTYLEKF